MILKHELKADRCTTFQSMLNRRALSDVVETPGRRREETRAVEMVRVGQALKLEAIVRGLAPTSLATVGPLKPRPWEPRCIYPDFPHEIVCGDIWSDSKLILATEAGTFLLEGKYNHYYSNLLRLYNKIKHTLFPCHLQFRDKINQFL